MFKTKTLDSILGTFSKTVEELNTFMANAKKQRQDNTDQINRLMEDNARIADEITRANNAAEAINSLIGK